jgi:hypothetical protein
MMIANDHRVDIRASIFVTAPRHQAAFGGYVSFVLNVGCVKMVFWRGVVV